MIRTLSLVLLFAVANLAHASDLTPAQAKPGVSVQRLGNLVTLSNGFTELTFDCASHRVVRLSADHTGQGHFRANLLSREGMDIEGDAGGAPATVRIAQMNPQRASVSFRWGPAGRPVRLIVSLHQRDRGVHVEAVLPNSTDYIRLMLRQWFLLGIFQRGVVQYVAGQSQYFNSTNPLRLFYTIDRRNGSVALVPDAVTAPREASLLSGNNAMQCGIVLRAQIAPDIRDQWRDGTPRAALLATGSKSSRLGFSLYANDLPYPAHRKDSRVDGMSDAQARSIAAYFTATYASAAGVLGSYSEPGSAYPTLAHPGRPYGNAFNFFDPDSWETVTTLAYSGDPLLQREARRILERSEGAQLPDGQIPHHFVNGNPTFLSIAGSSQTGPNIFWTLAAIEYVTATGNEKWLRAHYAHLRMATDWVLARYNPREELVRASGPLFIDVFRRSGFTLDTNVFTYYLLGRMSGVAASCEDSVTARRYLVMRTKLREGILRNLWNGQDHFVTERHADGSTRDFVDYDGNFAALAFGILPGPADARRLLRRLDSGPHVHPGGYGTWVSERRYDKRDCYKENDGDSDVAMARIWWLDMAARVRMGDIASFDAMFTEIENDLLHDVWLPERYDSVGKPAHNSYYHEYPEVFTMVLREMRYGVHLGLQGVAIRPFGERKFSLHLGALRVDFSPTHILLTVPGSNERSFIIKGLMSGQRYFLSTGQRLTSDAHGNLNFIASAEKPLVISQEKMANQKSAVNHRTAPSYLGPEQKSSQRAGIGSEPRM